MARGSEPRRLMEEFVKEPTPGQDEWLDGEALKTLCSRNKIVRAIQVCLVPSKHTILGPTELRIDAAGSWRGVIFLSTFLREIREIYDVPLMTI